jgi:toxin ParE1/3/4
MSHSVIVRDRATQDLRRLANYILANGNREVAERFLESAEYTFNQLALTPNMGRFLMLLDLQTIRQWRIKNFKDYLIFYRVDSDQVDVLRVLHGAIDLEEILPFLDREI